MPKLLDFSLKKACLAIATITIATISISTHASKKEDEPALLVIGASYGNASVPFFSNLQAPLGGIAVNQGQYLSLGNALIRERSLSGHVINEAQAGATTFDRLGCFPGPECISPGWEGFDKQFTKAVARVTSFNDVKADYVVITTGNDCNHPDAFGIPMSETSECTVTQMNQSIDNIIAVGRRALDMGITPIFGGPRNYHDLDLELFRANLGWEWIISKESFDFYSELTDSRIREELPDAIIIDNMWKGFEHLGDGLHPDRKTVKRAAKRIAKAIKKHRKNNKNSKVNLR